MKSFTANEYCCVPNAVTTLIAMVLLLSSSSDACSRYCSASAFGTKIAQAEVIAVAYLWKDISPPLKNQNLPWETKYYQGYVSSVYKGNETLGNGEIIVRSVGACDSFPVHQHVVVFGDVIYQRVEGFGTPMPVLQPNACSASGMWTMLATEQQSRLEALDPQEKDPCEQQDCDEFTQVPPPPVDCGDGNTVQPYWDSCKLGSTSNICEPDIFFPECP